MSNQLPKICKDAEILTKNDGNITFGNGCIIHPKASIIAEDGCSIIFGEYNIIEEQVIIRAYPKYNSQLNSKTPTTIYIGNYNHFKIGCRLENTNIDNYNIIDYRVEGEECTIESKCVITPLVKIPKRAQIKSGSIVLENKLIVFNSSFKENEFKNGIIELSKLLCQILPANHQMHSIQS